MPLALAIDAGTTGVRTLAINTLGEVVDLSYRPLTQYFPAPGWVEHDATEIASLVIATLREVASRQVLAGETISTIGITNQRETTIAFDRDSARPLHRAIVWQDRRTAARCESLRAKGAEQLVNATTGLVLDPYFSATKMSWLFEAGVTKGVANPAMATVDTWILYVLTGGSNGGVLLTDPSNASRTMLYDLDRHCWSQDMASLFGVEVDWLAEIAPSKHHFGNVSGNVVSELDGVPIWAMLGDQQAALFGQGCIEPAMAKVTYGTGCFVLENAGSIRPAREEGLTVSVAWDLDDGNGPVFAVEGSAFNAGAAIDWLRDELGIIASAADLGPLAASVPDAGGLVVVPAFTGLGSPWFDPRARGVITGITRGSGRAQFARAVIEALAFQVRAITDAMARSTGHRLAGLRADGGAAAMDLLLELQASLCQTAAERPVSLETTAIGVATLAAIGCGETDLTTAVGRWRAEARFVTGEANNALEATYGSWLGAVERSRNWDDGPAEE